jgi:hypothetical protein
MSTKFQINFKNFSLDEIKKISPGVSMIPRIKINKEERFSIGDCPDIRLNAGSENLYLDVVIYEYDKFEPINISFYSKEDHKAIKQIAKDMIDLF